MRRACCAINRSLSYIAAVALGLLMFLTIADIIGRYLFNKPVTGTFELTEMSMVLIVFLALGLAQQDKEHIALDLAYNYFSPWLKRIVDCFADLISVLVVGAVTWQLFEYSGRMAQGEYSVYSFPCGWALFPFKLKLAPHAEISAGHRRLGFDQSR